MTFSHFWKRGKGIFDLGRRTSLGLMSKSLYWCCSFFISLADSSACLVLSSSSLRRRKYLRAVCALRSSSKVSMEALMKSEL